WLAFNRDGSRLYAAGGSRMGDPQRLHLDNSYEVKAWDVASGQGLFTAAGQDGDIQALRVSPDGTRLGSLARMTRPGAIGNAQFTVTHWDAASGKELGSWGRDATSAEGLTFSPDGRHVAVTLEEAEGEGGNRTFRIRTLELSTGKWELALEGPRHFVGLLDSTSHLSGPAEYSPDG